MTDWKQHRIEQGWTQRQLAQKAGVCPRRLCEWETGRRRPNSANRRKIERALELSPGSLVDPEATLDETTARRLRPARCEELQTDEGHTYATLENRCAGVVQRLQPHPPLPPALKRALRVDTGAEVVALLLLWCFGFRGDYASPVLLGFDAHALVTAALRAVALHRRACLRIAQDGRDVFAWPQASLRYGESILRIDLLVGVFYKGRSSWFAVEIDGSTHVGRERQDAYRDARLRIPVLRYSNSQVLSLSFARDLWQRLSIKLPDPTSLAHHPRRIPNRMG